MEERELIKRREDVPHIAVIFLNYEVHEKVVETGECRGLPVKKGQRIFKIEGVDKFICLRKVDEFLEVMKNGTGQ